MSDQDESSANGSRSQGSQVFDVDDLDLENVPISPTTPAQSTTSPLTSSTSTAGGESAERLRLSVRQDNRNRRRIQKADKRDEKKAAENLLSSISAAIEQNTALLARDNDMPTDSSPNDLFGKYVASDCPNSPIISKPVQSSKFRMCFSMCSLDSKKTLLRQVNSDTTKVKCNRWMMMRQCCLGRYESITPINVDNQ
jgi:hypothetical protein